MLRFLVLSVLFSLGIGETDHRIVSLDQGLVKGDKYWNGDSYDFFGVPYAKVPVGKDRFKGPLPPNSWEGILEANNQDIHCPQIFYTGEDPENSIIIGEDECLTLNLFVPKEAGENNLLPVMVYIHSGAFAIGHGNMAKYYYIVRHDVIIVSINFRIGAIGFACLGTEDIPGNAGLKDQVAALKWINKNINKFGGDPKKVTVVGFSVGAAMAELLTMSKTSEGLIDKIILESGSAFSPWSINRDPIATATNIAVSAGYNNTGKIKDLTEFLVKADSQDLARKSLHFFQKNGTFGFAPCIENVHKGIEPFLTEDPVEIFKKGENNKVAVLTGFANMEGISRINHFDTWGDDMEENFVDFLPTDLKFPDDESRKDVIKEIKEFYFHGQEVSTDTLQSYVDYNSDFMFKYSILRSAKAHAKHLERPVFFYEFAYVGELSAKHNFMDLINGASHRDQTSYILEFNSWTSKSDDLDTRDRLTMMWTDFAKYENPTAYESSLISFKWNKFTEEHPSYLHINKTSEIKKNPILETFSFWEKLYKKYYWKAEAPKTVLRKN